MKMLRYLEENPIGIYQIIKHREVTLFIDVSAFGLFQNYEILQIKKKIMLSLRKIHLELKTFIIHVHMRITFLSIREEIRLYEYKTVFL